MPTEYLNLRHTHFKDLLREVPSDSFIGLPILCILTYLDSHTNQLTLVINLALSDLLDSTARLHTDLDAYQSMHESFKHL